MFNNGHDGCGKSDYDFERLNYHYGQMMVERDFRDQQRYYNEKRWMLNRYGIGWGVLHGLKVRIKTDNAVGAGTPTVPPCIEVEPGFAIDKYGNEILVTAKQSIHVDKVLNEKSGNSDKKTDERVHASSPVYIGVRYRECGTEPFRLPDSHCCDIDADCSYSRTKETQEFVVSHTPWPVDDEQELRDDHGCVIDCFKDLRNPATRIIEDHPEREKNMPVPLATLFYFKDRWVIDNIAIRPIAYSNYHLGELIGCLTSEMRKVHGAGYDRKSFVPLLAQTIPGLKFRSGRTKLHENFGELPFRITTDGKYVWCTDLQLDGVHHFPIETVAMDSHPRFIKLSNGKSGWGIAFDGHNMWVTVPEAKAVEKINICTLEKTTYELTVEKKMIQKDDRHDHDGDHDYLDDHHHDGFFNNPREIVFDGHYLWISHGPRSLDTSHPDAHDEHSHESMKSEKDVAGKLPKHDLRFEKMDQLWLTRLDTFNGEVKNVFIEQEGRSSPVIGMVFDGRAIWFAYNDSHNRALARRLNIMSGVLNQVSKENAWQIDEPIELRGNGARDIAFDGNAVWVTHEEGASKIDISEYSEVAVTSDRGRLSSMVFDGRKMWMVQNRENESELRRCDLFSMEHHGGYELHNKENGLHIGRICFDGSYLWVTGNKLHAETGKGVLYRILP